MKSVVVTAKNIEKAIEDGLSQLNTTIEYVDINVISEGGLFKKAKVELVVSDFLNEASKSKTKDSKVKETKFSKAELEQDLPTMEELKAELKKDLQDLGKVSALSVPQQKTEIEDKTLSDELAKIESELRVYEKPTASKKQTEVAEVEEIVKEFLQGLIESFGVIANVETSHSAGTLTTRVVGENLGFLIGYHGEALNAIQYLTNTVVQNKTQTRIRVLLDIENYRKKREDTLKSMASKLAKNVQQSKKPVKLEPMTSFERKVIHAHLQEFKNIQTHSEGKEPKRYLVIKYTTEK